MNKSETAVFVKKLKAKYEVVYEVHLDALDDYPAISSYFRKPSIDELGIYMTKTLTDDNTVDAQEILLRTIFIGGDDDFFNDGMFLLDVAESLSDIVSGYPIEVEVKVINNVRGYEIKILAEDEQPKIVIRRPNPGELSQYQKSVRVNALTATRSLYKKCYLEGDKSLLDQDEYFISAAQALDRIVKRRTARMEKL